MSEELVTEAEASYRRVCGYLLADAARRAARALRHLAEISEELEKAAEVE